MIFLECMKKAISKAGVVTIAASPSFLDDANIDIKTATEIVKNILGLGGENVVVNVPDGDY